MSAPEPQRFSHFPHLPPPVRVRLTTLSPHPCSYLPERQTTLRALAAEAFDPSIYCDFLNRGFRRSGTMVYQPVCLGCRQCRPIRVPVRDFSPSRSQRRTVPRNADLTVAVDEPRATDERFDLYTRYTRHWHLRDDPATFPEFAEFLYHSPTNTVEFTYRDPAGRLLGVGICDVVGDVLSSVYFYFDPDEARRSLGTYAALREIDFAQTAGLAYYHLGYWIADCPAMAYKANFRPAETLDLDGVWRPIV